MKKPMKIVMAIATFVLLISAAACGPAGSGSVKAESITLNKLSLPLVLGETEKLTATVLPVNTSNKTVTWSVTDADPVGCVSVAQDGTVTAESLGVAKVVAKTADGSLSAACAVTVEKPPLNNLTMNKSVMELKVGESETLTAAPDPEDEEVTLVWKSSRPDLASVVEGKVTALGIGSNIKITAEGGGKTAACTLNIVLKTGDYIFEAEDADLTAITADDDETETARPRIISAPSASGEQCVGFMDTPGAAITFRITSTVSTSVSISFSMSSSYINPESSEIEDLPVSGETIAMTVNGVPVSIPAVTVLKPSGSGADEIWQLIDFGIISLIPGSNTIVLTALISCPDIDYLLLNTTESTLSWSPNLIEPYQ